MCRGTEAHAQFLHLQQYTAVVNVHFMPAVLCPEISATLHCVHLLGLMLCCRRSVTLQQSSIVRCTQQELLCSPVVLQLQQQQQVRPRLQLQMLQHPSSKEASCSSNSQFAVQPQCLGHPCRPVQQTADSLQVPGPRSGHVTVFCLVP